MNYQKHFKFEDIHEAEKEHKCIKDLIVLILLNTDSGNVSKAKDRGVELMNSLHRLEQLNESKRDQDELNNLLHQLLNDGKARERVGVYFNDRAI